jgi:hypothetical protein
MVAAVEDQLRSTVSSSSSSSSSSPNDNEGRRSSTPSTPPEVNDDDEIAVNPLYTLSQRAEKSGEEVHIYVAKPDEVIIREGTPITSPIDSILHPLAWSEPTAPPNQSEVKAHGKMMVMENSNGVETEYRDKGKSYSKADEASMAAVKGHMDSRRSSSQSTLKRQSKEVNPAANNNGNGMETASGSGLPRDVSRGSMEGQSIPPRTPPKTSTPRFSSVSPKKSPKSNPSPSLPRTLSRHSSNHSVARQREIDTSLSKPLPAIALNDTTASTTAERFLAPTPPLRRSTTADSPSRATPWLETPVRAQSQDSGSPKLASSDTTTTYFAPGEGPWGQTTMPTPDQISSPVTSNDVESSIARQATLIRRDRAAKKAEAEKESARRNQMIAEQEEVARAAVASASASGSGGGGVSNAGGSALRRRSTRAGSGGDRVALGTGVLVGNLIGQDHANYVLMYNMLTGIRIAVSLSSLLQYRVLIRLLSRVSVVTNNTTNEQVSRCQAKVKRPLTDEDYTARHKFSFDM